MSCFIKKVFENKVDEAGHRQFVRFGKGEYKGRAALSLIKTASVKLRGSFEYANDFVELVAELGNVKFSGIVLSKEKLDFASGKMKTGLWNYDVSGIDSDKIREIKERAYYLLLDAEAPGISLKIKKKLHKPGKSGEAKIDDGFCILEADLKYWHKIKEDFLWDIPDCKKCKVKHEYIINELDMPKGEKDFEKIRLMTRRKGKINRVIEIDKVEKVVETDFCA